MLLEARLPGKASYSAATDAWHLAGATLTRHGADLKIALDSGNTVFIKDFAAGAGRMAA